MNNSDMPAMPVLHTIDGNWVKEPLDEYKGLTKREHMATMAMDSVQAFILAQTDADAYSEDQFANMCNKRADALLIALEKQQ